jgi:uncharacterized protein YxjI
MEYLEGSEGNICRVLKLNNWRVPKRNIWRLLRWNIWKVEGNIWIQERRYHRGRGSSSTIVVQVVQNQGHC